ncbi:hypothetical protein HanRHA438_Chr00c22g0853281 [Helianthus annuus]|nr:hypothetical protein HanRHA438_Chr00c22g0853281 [Helianthus annuus]
MKRHNSLYFQPMFFGHLQQFRITTPIILTGRLPLHQPPPHIHHHPLHPRTLQRLHTRVHRLPPIHSIPHRNTIQRHHHIHRHPLRFLNPTSTGSMLLHHHLLLRHQRLARHRQIRPYSASNRTHWWRW